MMDRRDRETEKLQLAVNELKVLNDVATTISSTQPVDEIIDRIVQKCIKHLGVQEGTISLLEKEEDQSAQFHTMIRRQDSSGEMVPIRLDSRLTGWMLKNRKILMSNNIRDDERFNFLDESSYSFSSILCAPLLAKDDLIGYLAVFNKKGGEEFTQQDRRLLSIIASQSAQVIENARLYEEEKALISLQEEMRMARNIQLNLLPKEVPDIEGFDIAAINIPAKLVGGDYYDFLAMESGSVGFCVGDITGKGMPAAMLMANLQATLRSQAMNIAECDACLERTNTLLFRSTESTRFATLFLGIFYPGNGEVVYANGGHDSPLLLRAGDDHPELLHSTGLLLGVMEEVSYSQVSIQMQPGDLMVIYTDGITEAMNSQEEEYGRDRMETVIRENRNLSAEELLEQVLADVREHSGGHPQSDDITLMVIRHT